MPLSGQYRTENLSLPECLAILRDAGTRSHGIRDYLHTQGVTGPIGDSNGCPVAKWLVSETGADAARVDSYMIELIYPGRRVVSEYTPTALAEHLDAFDQGRYPELIAA